MRDPCFVSCVRQSLYLSISRPRTAEVGTAVVRWAPPGDALSHSVSMYHVIVNRIELTPGFTCDNLANADAGMAAACATRVEAFGCDIRCAMCAKRAQPPAQSPCWRASGSVHSQGVGRLAGRVRSGN